MLWLLTLNSQLSTAPLAQQPQAQTGQPIYAVNAKYVNGVAPGYWPTAGSGLTLNLSSGTAVCGAPPAVIAYAGGTLMLTASQTNYVYLDPTASCAPALNTTGFIAGQIPLSKVVTSGSAITSITDARTWFVPQPVGVSSTGAATLVGPLTATATDSTSQAISYPGAEYIPWWFNGTYTQPTPTAWNNLQPLGVGLTALDGGFNVNQNGQSNKTEYMPFGNFIQSYTPGEHIGMGLFNYNYSFGDALPILAATFCYGGRAGGGDEGCEGPDFQQFMGNVEYSGSVSGSPGSGATSVTVSPTQGSGTQGAGRWLLDMTKATTGGTTSAFTWSSTTVPATVTISNAVASTVVGTLGTAVTPGNTQSSVSATVTPTFSTGAITNLTTSTLVAVADPGNYELVYPTSVNTGAGTFTATFRKSHPSTAIISAGGLEGKDYGALADQFTNSSFSNLTQTITGTLRQTWHIFACTATGTGTCDLWTSFAGTEYLPYPGMWSAGTNGHTLYPGAEVTSVRNGGATLSNTLGLAPNAVAWASGDTVTLPIYPVTTVSGGNNTAESYFPTIQNQIAAPKTVMNGLWKNGDTAQWWVNNSPVGFYATYGANTYTPPRGLQFTGPFSSYIFASAPHDEAMFFNTCNWNPAKICSDAAQSPDYAVVRAYDGTGTGSNFDEFRFSPSANLFYATANGRAATLEFTVAASLTTTAAASDNVTIQGATGSSHCSLTATNASAATNIATTYVSAKTTNQITVTHAATPGMTYDVLCTPN